MPVEPLFKRYSETMRTLQIRDARIKVMGVNVID